MGERIVEVAVTTRRQLKGVTAGEGSDVMACVGSLSRQTVHRPRCAAQAARHTGRMIEALVPQGRPPAAETEVDFGEVRMMLARVEDPASHVRVLSVALRQGPAARAAKPVLAQGLHFLESAC